MTLVLNVTLTIKALTEEDLQKVLKAVGDVVAKYEHANLKIVVPTTVKPTQRP